MRSMPARAASRVLAALRQCPTTLVFSSWAVSQTVRISSYDQTLTSGPFMLGISPVTMTLIQSTPYLIWRRISRTIMSRSCTTVA